MKKRFSFFSRVFKKFYEGFVIKKAFLTLSGFFFLFLRRYKRGPRRGLEWGGNFKLLGGLYFFWKGFSKFLFFFFSKVFAASKVRGFNLGGKLSLNFFVLA